MTNTDLTLIAVLVDRSGSMASCREDMQGGLNTFLEDQRNEPGLLDVAIAQFDTHFEIVRPMGRLTEPYRFELVPRGGTALLDGMGRYITTIGEELAARPENQRPDKVIMVIITDGYENSSREWTKAKVKELVEAQRNQWRWEFIFLGAGMDAVAEGHSLGVSRGSSMTFDTASPQAVYNTYAAAGVYTSAARGPSVVGKAAPSFTAEDRKKAMGDEQQASK